MPSKWAYLLSYKLGKLLYMLATCYFPPNFGAAAATGGSTRSARWLKLKLFDHNAAEAEATHRAHLQEVEASCCTRKYCRSRCSTPVLGGAVGACGKRGCYFLSWIRRFSDSRLGGQVHVEQKKHLKRHACC